MTPAGEARRTDSQEPCEVCGGGPFVAGPRGIRGSSSDLARCTRCGWETLVPAPTWDQIQALYDAGYYVAWGMAEGETAEVAAMKKATFGLRLDEVREFAARGRLLDAGTASGFLLEVARERGFEPFGVELSEYAGALAARKFGPERIHIGTLETAAFEPGSFDVITMCDFIEHVPHPVATLARAAELLRPGGIVLIMAPDTGSLTRRLMGRRWTHYKLEHLSYFNRASMTAGAERAGLEMVRFGPCRKALRLRYLRTQLRAYPHWLLTPIVRAIAAACPFLLDRDQRLSIGEFVAILRKPPGPPPRGAGAVAGTEHAL